MNSVSRKQATDMRGCHLSFIWQSSDSLFTTFLVPFSTLFVAHDFSKAWPTTWQVIHHTFLASRNWTPDTSGIRTADKCQAKEAYH